MESPAHIPWPGGSMSVGMRQFKDVAQRGICHWGGALKNTFDSERGVTTKGEKLSKVKVLSRVWCGFENSFDEVFKTEADRQGINNIVCNIFII